MGKPVKRKRRPRKNVDEEVKVVCQTGTATIREETWVDVSGEVVRYNLAFINHFLCRVDNGRVLGYDNSHGAHYRHFKGKVEPFAFTRYQVLWDHFLAEVEVLKKEM